MLERSLVFIKPDGVSRKLVGRVLTRFEEKGLSLVKLEMLTMTSELSDKHYEEHVDKDFYPNLKRFITSGPIVVMVLEGNRAVEVIRRMVGDTDSAEAPAGTIRGDFSLDKGENIIHASDSNESATREIANFFPDIL
ncbi:nucleoside-diphosphate kinase [Candidatus Marinamargulisbacteria bacterium SCGC AG-439-L15]|nr:nucleoside-diphosphate kinase [Candidatus Marinamargulisbacteria bacterium SCGC AG-439-L15]